MERSGTEQRWIKRTAVSTALRGAVIAGPFAASLVFAWIATRLTVVPSTTLLTAVRWLAIATLSTVVLVVAERQLRRLMPLIALLKLPLSFPDRAPSRLRIALRTSSDRQLKERVADARAGNLGETEGEAAIRVLELVAALNLHDPLTRGHSERVRAYSQMIGKEMGLDGAELDRLMWAGLLHDIGKLLVPTEVLNKPGKLTDDEFGEIKKHPEYGKVLVAPLTSWLGESARAVWEHHERWSGGGYPRGIEGLDISQSARIVSVADTFDVITSVRSYKSRTSPQAARAELARCSGSQFDPAVVKAFMNASIHRYSWMSSPAAWLAQTTLLPPAAVSAIVRSGVVASGLTVGGLTLASGASANDLGKQPPSTTIAPIEAVVPADSAATDTDESTPETDSNPSDTSPDPTVDSPDPSTSLDPDRPPSTNLPDTAVPPGTPPPTPPTLPVTVPGTSTPGITNPGITNPPVTLPPVTVPPITGPVVTVPVITVPVISLPPISLPPVDLPEIGLPGVDLPGIDVPPITVPVITTPAVSVPPIALPDLSEPDITVPTITLPNPLGL